MDTRISLCARPFVIVGLHCKEAQKGRQYYIGCISCRGSSPIPRYGETRNESGAGTSSPRLPAMNVERAAKREVDSAVGGNQRFAPERPQLFDPDEIRCPGCTSRMITMELN